ncbi:MAG TPA: CinA family nicotinamide mononucleotide deamidase-related protein [Geobacterales bacterium]|nr:CinA family nicotinamide mononucleotide deamidase-related protein [Geobacterales bacterium]
MRIATLSIGDELIRGEIVDSNAAWLAAILYDHGMAVTTHLTVPDDERLLVDALQQLSQDHDTIIATGGLGSTTDDVTARAAARATGRRLMVNEDALRHLRQYAERNGTTLVEADDRQALIPARGEILANPLGTAPGFTIEEGSRFYAFLPGVPAEMERMTRDSLIPALLARRRDRRHFTTRVLRIFGLSEVQVARLVAPIALPEKISLSFLPSYPEILLKVRGEAGPGEELELSIDAVVERLRTKLSPCLYAEEDVGMAITVGNLFRQQGRTLSLAESCTGGLLSTLLTDGAGSSDFFLAGQVTYSNAAKERDLGVPMELISHHGAVSAEVAMAMAEGSRQRSGSDLAIAITGIAGPSGGTLEKPVGTVYMALADAAGSRAKRYQFYGDRGKIRTISAFTAMDWLRRVLLGL